MSTESPLQQPQQSCRCPHEFHLHSFRKFTHCGVCHEFLWGLVRQGYLCRLCSLASHKRCLPPSSSSTTSTSTTSSKLIRVSSRGQMLRSSKILSTSGMYDGDEEEATEDEWFMDEADEEAERQFEILERPQLDAMLLELVSLVSSQLALSKGDAQLLLRHFAWSPDRLLRVYFDDPERHLSEAGVAMPKVSGQAITECPVCMSDCSESYALGCGHSYCRECWAGHVTNALASMGTSVGDLGCMFPGCRARMSFEDWEKVAEAGQYGRYWYFSVKEFVERPTEKCRKFVFCTDSNCSRAIHYRGVGKPTEVVECECGRRFCFSCGAEKHNPVSCEQLASWNEHNSDDQESVRMVKATSKNCFHCGWPTERNQGCNHMTCSRCRGQWCWMCRGDWSTHGTHTGGYYSCNKYSTSEAKKLDDWATQFLEDSRKTAHYYERWFNHGTSRRHMEDVREGLLRAAEEYGSATSVNLAPYLSEAIDLLVECRSVLSHTYIYGYFVSVGPRAAKALPFFEFLQANAEGITERLSELVTGPPDKIALDDLKNLTRVARKYMANLCRGIEEGLVAPAK